MLRSKLFHSDSKLFVRCILQEHKPITIMVWYWEKELFTNVNRFPNESILLLGKLPYGPFSGKMGLNACAVRSSPYRLIWDDTLPKLHFIGEETSLNEQLHKRGKSLPLQSLNPIWQTTSYESMAWLWYNNTCCLLICKA